MRAVGRLLLACTTFALVSAPLPAGGATPLRVPDSIDVSGRADVTDQLNRFFASVPVGATVEFPDHGRYLLEGVLRLVNLERVAIDGNGSEILARTDGRDVAPPPGRYKARWPRLREHITVQGANGLTVSDLSIRGPNASGEYRAALEGQAGIAVYKSRSVVIDHVSVSNTYGDGVYVAGASDDVDVRDGSFDSIGRQGIAVVNATHVVIEGNHLRKIARSVFDLEPAVPRWTISDVHMRDNDVGDYGNFLLAAGGAGPNVSDVWLEGNRVTGGNGIAVFAGMPRWLRRGLHVIDNVSDVDGRQVSGTSRGGVMQIAQIDGVEIRGNRQPVESGAVAVTLDGVCNLTMRDNDFPGASSEKQQTGTCSPGLGASPGTTRNDPRARKRAGTGNVAGRATPDAGVKDAKNRKGSTDRDWMVAGGLAGAAALAILGQQALRKRARARM